MEGVFSGFSFQGIAHLSIHTHTKKHSSKTMSTIVAPLEHSPLEDAEVIYQACKGKRKNPDDHFVLEMFM